MCVCVCVCVWVCVCAIGHPATKLISFQQRITSCFAYRTTNLIDQAVVNAARLMTTTTNVILCAVTGSVFLFSFPEACASPAGSALACVSFKNQVGIITNTAVSHSLTSSWHVFRCQQMSNCSTISPIGLLARLHCVCSLWEGLGRLGFWFW